ncbi:MAG TPA: flagellar motor protein [candidate division Zixibacteria bacterium]|nr:flagellar motor protein [candidate division Zixibacteria bacterium]MDD4917133.1 flagellar motor protein [candidate division Zixibacteria bacterium]MDM7972683.1 flagellar motor protein [candidate division Zixibacteria bacterium]HOD65401.1 flagellar motor protein [candidate division Zixibacteria bacterium]HPC10585.1 flagellar motor protein [candidate division Zixibacteria bacterium]
MDLATLIGLVVAFGAVGGSFLMEGGSFDAVFLAAPILIVVGGTLGATTVTTSIDTVNHIPHYLRIAFFGRSHRFSDTIEQIVKLGEKARREGILGLERDMERIRNPFFRKAVRLVIDGTETSALREILETEIAYLEARHKRGITFFQKAGGYSPTMGILGTVLGLVHTLGNTSDASRMAAHIAAAFIATLWGVGLANLFFLPVSDKLRMRHEEEIAHLELIMEGIMALQSGENPRHIRTRLLAFIAPIHRNHEE